MNLNLPRGTAAWFSICLLAPPVAFAQALPGGAARPLTFEDASSLLAKASDSLSGADANVRAAQDQADALKALRRPVISVDAQELEYQKTIDLSLGGLKAQAEGAASSTLNGINAAGVPGASSDVVGAVTSQVQAALPSIFSSIPDSISLRTRQTLFHPTVTALLPLYTGGAIPAAQRAAAAAVELARAKQSSAQDALQVELVRAYFGQVLAAQVLSIARDTRDGFDRHLDDAGKLEKEGQISRARVLDEGRAGYGATSRGPRRKRLSERRGWSRQPRS